MAGNTNNQPPLTLRYRQGHIDRVRPTRPTTQPPLSTRPTPHQIRPTPTQIQIIYDRERPLTVLVYSPRYIHVGLGIVANIADVMLEAVGQIQRQIELERKGVLANLQETLPAFTLLPEQRWVIAIRFRFRFIIVYLKLNGAFWANCTIFIRGNKSKLVWKKEGFAI